MIGQESDISQNHLYLCCKTSHQQHPPCILNINTQDHLQFKSISLQAEQVVIVTQDRFDCTGYNNSKVQVLIIALQIRSVHILTVSWE